MTLCRMVLDGQKNIGANSGFVAASVIDPEGNIVRAVANNIGGKNGWRHGERNAIDKYISKYKDIPPGCVVVTNLSPCNSAVSGSRFGSNCTDYLLQHGINDVYCGFVDFKQGSTDPRLNLVVTQNASIHSLCEKIALMHLPKELFNKTNNIKDKPSSLENRLSTRR